MLTTENYFGEIARQLRNFVTALWKTLTASIAEPPRAGPLPASSHVSLERDTRNLITGRQRFLSRKQKHRPAPAGYEKFPREPVSHFLFYENSLGD